MKTSKISRMVEITLCEYENLREKGLTRDDIAYLIIPEDYTEYLEQKVDELKDTLREVRELTKAWNPKNSMKVYDLVDQMLRITKE